MDPFWSLRLENYGFNTVDSFFISETRVIISQFILNNSYELLSPYEDLGSLFRHCFLCSKEGEFLESFLKKKKDVRDRDDM